MSRKGWLRDRGRLATGLVLVVALALPMLLAGCGAQTPQQAVRDFYDARANGDWNAYLGTILPDRVRRMTPEDVSMQKESFEGGDFKYTDMKLEVVEKGNDKAEVQLVGGKITSKNPMTNQEETWTIEEIKEMYNETPSLDTVKYKGRWYVDIPMSAEDQEKAQAEMMEQQEQMEETEVEEEIEVIEPDTSPQPEQ